MIVYKLTSPSGKSYIGITARKLNKRWNDHVSEAKRKNVRKIHKAINKYSPDSWIKEIIFETENKKEACKKEIEYIEKYDTIKNGYNLSPGGECSALGLKRTLETCLKISQAKKGIKLSEERKKQIGLSQLGKKQPQSQKDKVREANSQNWRIVDPQGKQFNIRNLRQFCKENKLSQGSLIYHGYTKGWKIITPHLLE